MHPDTFGRIVNKLSKHSPAGYRLSVTKRGPLIYTLSARKVSDTNRAARFSCVHNGEYLVSLNTEVDTLIPFKQGHTVWQVADCVNSQLPIPPLRITVMRGQRNTARIHASSGIQLPHVEGFGNFVADQLAMTLSGCLHFRNNLIEEVGCWESDCSVKH